MSSFEDDVLEVSVNEQSDFSGFDSSDIRKTNIVNAPFVGAKEVVDTQALAQASGSKTSEVNPKTKKKVLPSKEKSSKKNKVSKHKKSLVDLENLSEHDIFNLRQKLGLVETHGRFDITKAPNLHVEVNSEDILLSDEENTASLANKAYDDSSAPNKLSLVEALFGSNNDTDTEDEWGLPKLKSIEKDKPIAQSLASLINTACTSQCDTETLMSKYKVPENCDKLTPPLVNNEVWKVLDKRARSYDRAFVDIQNLVATGMVPVIKLAEILKPYIVGNTEAKQMLSDVLTLMGQIQFNLSLRRRYLIRPNLKKKYSNLCNINVPITTSLFGDDVLKEIKNCETGVLNEIVVPFIPLKKR